MSQFEISCGVEATVSVLLTLRSFLPVFPALRNSSLCDSDSPRADRKNRQEKSISMGEQDRNGGFRSISENFKIVKSTGVMVSSSFGDRLTTGRRQPSLYMDVRFLACRRKKSSPSRLNISRKISN